MRLLVLVIANHDPVYDAHWSSWRQTMVGRHPSVDVYFLVGNPSQAEAVVVDEATRCVSIRVEETLIPGITIKTIEGLRWMVEHRRDVGYTHVLRTNMSSVWHWPRLLKRLPVVPTDSPALGASYSGTRYSGPSCRGRASS